MGSQQQNIIFGTLLGDEFLEQNGKNFRLVVDHSIKQKVYVEWKAFSLKQFKPSIVIKERKDSRNNRTYVHCVMRTQTSTFFNEYFLLFYKGRRKVIPEKFPDLINPQILAVWIMDDGYHRNDCNALRLNTQGFTFSEHLTIQKALATLLIDSHIQNHKDKFVVYIPSRSMSRLRDLVLPFICKPMEYKVV